MEVSADAMTCYVGAGAQLLVIIIALTMRDRKKFILLNICASFGFGIGFVFFPHAVLGFQVKYRSTFFC